MATWASSSPAAPATPPTHLDVPGKDSHPMDINTTICVGDLPLPENVKAVYDQNFAIVSVLSKAKEAAEAAE